MANFFLSVISPSWENTLQTFCSATPRRGGFNLSAGKMSTESKHLCAEQSKQLRHLLEILCDSIYVSQTSSGFPI